MNIKVTDRELEALLIAINFYKESCAGWSSDEMSKDTAQDLKALTRISGKVQAEFDATAEALAGLAN